MLSSTALQGSGVAPLSLGLEEQAGVLGSPVGRGHGKGHPFHFVMGLLPNPKVLKCSGSIFCDFKEYKLPLWMKAGLRLILLLGCDPEAAN